MTEYSVSDSFAVRVYRFDTDDYRKIVGLVEAMDETGEKEHFAHIDELAAILNHRVAATRKGNSALSCVLFAVFMVPLRRYECVKSFWSVLFHLLCGFFCPYVAIFSLIKMSSFTGCGPHNFKDRLVYGVDKTDLHKRHITTRLLTDYPQIEESTQ